MTFEMFIYYFGAFAFAGGLAWTVFAAVDRIERRPRK